MRFAAAGPRRTRTIIRHGLSAPAREVFIIVRDPVVEVHGSPPQTRPHRAARSRAGDWVRRPQNLQPLVVFTLTRGVFLVLTYVGVILFQGSGRFAGPHPSYVHQLLPSWGRWDALWYIDIAARGYDWTKAGGTTPTAFFPLYPLLIHVLNLVLHRPLLSAMLISNACFLVALLVLWRLVAWEFSGDVARRTTLYISVFPSALFFFAGYTESLFLATTVASFYAMRRRRWLLAGVLTALASATRIHGVLLLVPLVYEYSRDHNFDVRRMLEPRLLGVIVAPAGLLAFMVYLGWAVHDPLAFAHNQAAWQKIFTLRIWAGILESLRQIFVVQPPASFFEVHNLLNLSAGLLALGLTVYGVHRLPAAYTLYLVPFWLVTLAEPALAGGYPVPLVSLARYVSILFPLFMVLAREGKRPWVHDAYLVGSASLLAVLTVVLVNGRWIV